jgi:hypothetical protein
VLFLAAGVGKPQVNELHIAFFHQFKYVCYRHFALLSWETNARDFQRATVSAGTMPSKINQ